MARKAANRNTTDRKGTDRKAADVMQTSIVSVSPHDSLHTVQRLFYEEGIHGAPVIDEHGQLQGIITSTDVLRAAAEASDAPQGAATPFGGALEFSAGAWSMEPELFRERLGDARVGDYMTQHVVQVAPETPVSDVARILRENGIHRVLVVEQGKLCGIVSAFDLVALLER